MRSTISLALVLAFLTGCATQKVSLKESNREVITGLSNIEILYHDTKDFPVVDLGGSKASGLAGLFGPIGLAVAIVADGASKLTMKERAEKRAAEFTAAINSSIPNANINVEFANLVAEQLRSRGKQVKVTKIKRPIDWEKPQTEDAQDLPHTTGYARLILRTATGYGAESATSRYEALIILDAVLQDDTGKTLAGHSETKRNFNETYRTYNELLNDHKRAAEALRAELNNMAEGTYRTFFEF